MRFSLVNDFNNAKSYMFYYQKFLTPLFHRFRRSQRATLQSSNLAILSKLMKRSGKSISVIDENDYFSGVFDAQIAHLFLEFDKVWRWGSLMVEVSC